MERLQKVIAEAGIASRRKAEDLIKDGKVVVNGVIVTELGVKVSNKDVVEVDGKIIEKEAKEYYLLNKPRGVVTTTNDDKNRKTVVDLIDTNTRIYPVGRLDYDTTGVLLLTNDGEFANKVMHPKNEVEKVYEVTTDKELTKDQIEKLEKGIDIGDYITKEAKVEVVSKTKFKITIHEGKNRQVRRMCEATNIKLSNLKRIQEGNIALGKLETGKYRYLTKEEISMVD